MDRPSAADRPFPILPCDVARYATAVGALLVLLLPAARGSHELLGWLPLWLLAMPALAWWLLHRASSLPMTSPAVSGPARAIRGRAGVPARRRARPARPALPRAA